MTREEKIKEILNCLKRLGVNKLQSTIDLEEMPDYQLDALLTNLKKMLGHFGLD